MARFAVSVLAPGQLEHRVLLDEICLHFGKVGQKARLVLIGDISLRDAAGFDQRSEGCRYGNHLSRFCLVVLVLDQGLLDFLARFTECRRALFDAVAQQLVGIEDCRRAAIIAFNNGGWLAEAHKPGVARDEFCFLGAHQFKLLKGGLQSQLRHSQLLVGGDELFAVGD